MKTTFFKGNVFSPGRLKFNNVMKKHKRRTFRACSNGKCVVLHPLKNVVHVYLITNLIVKALVCT